MERQPKVLFYDIETSPIIGYTWGVWQQDVVQIKEDWQILTIAWKWIGDKKVSVIGQDDLPGYKPGVNNDLEITKVLRELLDQADIVVAHNGNQFDQKKVRTRIVIHGLEPPSPFKQLDTKQIAKQYFAFTRNNLKWIAKDLQVAQKGDPGGFETWEGCLAGDKKAWKHMKKYNKQDIPPLEDIYLKFRPWVHNHPNMARLGDRPDACPKCFAVGTMTRQGYKRTTVGKKPQYKCTSCGGWCSARQALNNKEDVKPSYVNA